MKTGRLNEQMLKEMQLSFELTEQRELASGRRKPGKQAPPPVASKQKVIPKASSAPAEISPPKMQKVQMESPQKSKTKKKAAQKRPVPNKETIPDSSPSTKRPKKDVSTPGKSPKAKFQTISKKPVVMETFNITVPKKLKKGPKEKVSSTNGKLYNISS